jgi:hypothetical protein
MPRMLDRIADTPALFFSCCLQADNLFAHASDKMLDSV